MSPNNETSHTAAVDYSMRTPERTPLFGARNQRAFYFGTPCFSWNKSNEAKAKRYRYRIGVNVSTTTNEQQQN